MPDSLTQRINAVMDDEVLTSVINMRITNHSPAWNSNADEEYLARIDAMAEKMAAVAARDNLLSL
jgi:hypothetical protein